jgi:hypothetical protein
LVHPESLLLREVKTTLPSVSEAVWPLSWIAILLVPDVLLSPKPTLLPHGKDQFQNVGLTLPIDSALLDIEYERAIWPEHALQFG